MTRKRNTVGRLLTRCFRRCSAARRSPTVASCAVTRLQSAGLQAGSSYSTPLPPPARDVHVRDSIYKTNQQKQRALQLQKLIFHARNCKARRRRQRQSTRTPASPSASPQKRTQGLHNRTLSPLTNSDPPSPEIPRGGPRRHHRRVLRRLREVAHVALQLVVEDQDARDVAAAVAVVGGAPDRDKVLLREHVLEALLHQLVRAADELQSWGGERASAGAWVSDWHEGRSSSNPRPSSPTPFPPVASPATSAPPFPAPSPSLTPRAPLISLNSAVTLRPNSHPAPRGLTAHVSMSSGSDHIRSQKGPSWGISHTRSMTRTWSSVRMSGDSPPCTHSTRPSISACAAGWGGGRRGGRRQSAAGSERSTHTLQQQAPNSLSAQRTPRPAAPLHPDRAPRTEMVK